MELSIKADETVVFYPTFGHRLPDGSGWSFYVHGAVYEPEENSRARAIALDLFRRWLGLTAEQAETLTFKRRARSFLVDYESRKTISILLGTHSWQLGPSGRGGHFAGTFRMTNDEVKAIRETSNDEPGWLSFHALTSNGDSRRFEGRVQLIDPGGVSVISDIDDTIKHTQVTDRRALLANTFLRAFEPIPGMAELYRRLAAKGTAFHYVSASPWQLFGHLFDFLRAELFPSGTFHLKRFRLKQAAFYKWFAAKESHKPLIINLLLQAFPTRQFLLIGDSGEHDPEIYGAIARNYPHQIAGIYIRNVNGLRSDAIRFQEAFSALPNGRWTVFEEASELGHLLAENAALRQAETPRAT